MIRNKDPHRKLIIALSVLIPITIAVLFRVKIEGYDTSFLPPIYATINGITAILLVTAWIAIRSKRIMLHRRLMKTCLALSACFLIMYVVYHMTSDSTPYGGTGWIRSVYYFVLISHIVLSVAVVPLVLLAFSRAISGDFERHRALARFAFPVWLYVAVSGVIVYLMISPFYT
ncbi:MAG: DUF420 domain-containing protein [Cyclobacteriaceae bacterium]|jgi:putative membrane protein|nr:DUF420 domain-containing protein [Cyclobacteriaceae bacterium]